MQENGLRAVLPLIRYQRSRVTNGASSGDGHRRPLATLRKEYKTECIETELSCRLMF